MSQLEQVQCSRCGGDMPKLRLERYGYNYCTNCSTEQPKVAKIITYGSGEDIWSDIQIIDQDTARRLINSEENLLSNLEFESENDFEEEGYKSLSKKLKSNEFEDSE